MRHARWITLILILAIGESRPEVLAQPPSGADVLGRARSLMAKGDHEKAAVLLEEGLSEVSPAERGALIDLLRQSYRTLITRSEAGGKAAEAAAYRENLEILDSAGRDVSPETSPAVGPVPVATPGPARPAAPTDAQVSKSSASSSEPRPLPRTSSPPEILDLPEPAPLPKPDALPILSGPEPTPSERPVAEQQSPAGPSKPATAGPRATSPSRAAAPAMAGNPATPESSLSQADRLFSAKKYEEAGRLYARLAAANQLPAERKQVWAYCRWVAVVARINAQPRDTREWDEIEQEIRSVQRLTPGNWYGEYLQNRVSEARKAARPSGRGGRLVVRGSEPDEPPPRKIPRILGRSRPAAEPPGKLDLPPESNSGTTPPRDPTDPLPEAAVEQTAPADAGSADQAAPGSQPTAAEPAGPQAFASPPPPAPLAWQVRESANFRIYHMDPALAEKASVAAESIRSQQARRWGSSATRSTWSPTCEIYLYPTPHDFAEMTGQPETSPGFSTMGLSGNRITSRRVNLRADHPQLLRAILPHEVTHVVLADLFTQQQIPRWADEGMAVLAEPLAEQMNRAADLTRPLEEGRVFKLNELMAIDYPNAEAWNLYYAQSVSLTQFLVQLGTPEQFVRFVKGAQRSGVEVALREIYRIDGFAELENRWQAFARRQAAEIAALTRESATAGETTRRQ